MLDPRFQNNNPMFAMIPRQNDQAGALVVGGDLNFVTHIHGDGGGGLGQQNILQQQQMLMMQQQTMIQNQLVIEEQRNVQRRLAENVKRIQSVELKLIGDATDDASGSTKDFYKEVSLDFRSKDPLVIETQFEVIKEPEIHEDNKPKEEDKKMANDANIEIEELEKYEAIQQSLDKQIKSGNELPYVLTLNLPQTQFQMPIIFTVRNDGWRDKTRVVLQNMFSKKGLSSQKLAIAIPFHVMVVLYNAAKEAVEIIVLAPLELNDYITNNKNEFNEIVDSLYRSDDIFHCTQAILTIRRYFGLQNIREYYFLLEPIITKDTPYVIADKVDKEFIADTMLVKPVFSSEKNFQRISLNLYQRGLIKISHI
jgi:hypothetical protein